MSPPAPGTDEWPSMHEHKVPETIYEERYKEKQLQYMYMCTCIHNAIYGVDAIHVGSVYMYVHYIHKLIKPMMNQLNTKAGQMQT